jgi:NodT family efflux transporter outer membrane factor (OMF) lipoprotein
MPVPDHFKETGTWLPAQTLTPKSEIGPWWETFRDPVLNDLEQKLTLTNQDLQAAFFRYEQAAALAQVARSQFFPTIHGVGNANRQQNSLTVADPLTPMVYNNLLIGAGLNYEVDAWGSIRNAVAKSQNLAKASAADLAAASLSLHAELANDYFILRGYDESQRILNATVSAYEKALYLTRKRYQGGASPVEDVDNAQLQLENAKTLAAETHLKRAQMEHAIATLIGQIPSTFSLPAARLSRYQLQIVPNIPSTLLERRPDVAAAELRVKAANAAIGIARAAFFPAFDLNSIIGYQSQSLSNLITKPSLFWSLGPLAALTLVQPMASMTLFDGGKLTGQLKQAKASYYETVATYRQTVLTAFQEVEDSLIAIKQLDKENKTQSAATRAANRALRQEQNRYKGGVSTFLNVVVTENLALQADLASVHLITRRQIASIQLIKALGGGWATLRK